MWPSVAEDVFLITSRIQGELWPDLQKLVVETPRGIIVLNEVALWAANQGGRVIFEILRGRVHIAYKGVPGLPGLSLHSMQGTQPQVSRMLDTFLPAWQQDPRLEPDPSYDAGQFHN